LSVAPASLNTNKGNQQQQIIIPSTNSQNESNRTPIKQNYYNMNQQEVGQFSSEMLRKAAEYAHFNKQRENNVLSQQLAAMQMGGGSSVQNTPQQRGTMSSSSHSTPQQTNFGNMVVQSQQYGLPVSQVSTDYRSPTCKSKAVV